MPKNGIKWFSFLTSFNTPICLHFRWLWQREIIREEIQDLTGQSHNSVLASLCTLVVLIRRKRWPQIQQHPRIESHFLQDTWEICCICCQNVASWVNDLTSLSLWVLNKKRTGLGLWLDSQSMWEAPALILWTAEEGAGKCGVFGQDRRRFAWDTVHGAGFLLKAFLIAYTVWIYSSRNKRPSLGQMQTCPSENCT